MSAPRRPGLWLLARSPSSCIASGPMAPASHGARRRLRSGTSRSGPTGSAAPVVVHVGTVMMVTSMFRLKANFFALRCTRRGARPGHNHEAQTTKRTPDSGMTTTSKLTVTAIKGPNHNRRECARRLSTCVSHWNVSCLSQVVLECSLRLRDRFGLRVLQHSASGPSPVANR